MDSKLAITPEKLCEGLPEEFPKLLNYARKLEFEQKPDYKKIKNMFKDYLENNGIEMDFVFDWDIDNRLAEDITEDNKEDEESEKNKEKKINNNENDNYNEN